MKSKTAIEVIPPARIACQPKPSIGMAAMVASALFTARPLSKKLIDPVLKKISINPKINPQSPTRFAMNAFLAAGAASSLSR